MVDVHFLLTGTPVKEQEPEKGNKIDRSQPVIQPVSRRNRTSGKHLYSVQYSSVLRLSLQHYSPPSSTSVPFHTITFPTGRVSISINIVSVHSSHFVSPCRPPVLPACLSLPQRPSFRAVNSSSFSLVYVSSCWPSSLTSSYFLCFLLSFLPPFVNFPSLCFRFLFVYFLPLLIYVYSMEFKFFFSL